MKYDSRLFDKSRIAMKNKYSSCMYSTLCGDTRVLFVFYSKEILLQNDENNFDKSREEKF